LNPTNKGMEKMRQIKDCKEGTNIVHVIHIPPHLKKKTSHNFFPKAERQS